MDLTGTAGTFDPCLLINNLHSMQFCVMKYVLTIKILYDKKIWAQVSYSQQACPSIYSRIIKQASSNFYVCQ